MEIKNRQKVLAIVAAAGVLLLLGDKFVFSPLGEAWKLRADRIAAFRKSLADGSMLLQREQRQSIVQRWERLKTNTLPRDVSLAESEMLKAFERWSQESGISISSIKPQWKQNGEEYMTLECRADAAGDIGTVSRFLYEIEKDPLAVRIEAADLTARDNDGKQLSLALQLSGLLLTPQEK